MDPCKEAPALCSRDSIEDIWGPRTPYDHQWPTRVDHACDEEPEKWVQSACVLCSNGCGLDIGVKVGKISQGQAFIPFHFGYWDTKDGRARAANELTITEWDPISKQPTFKSGAISIETVPDDRPTAKERQSEALSKAEKNDATTSNVTENDLRNRERQLETWLGETYESILLLRGSLRRPHAAHTQRDALFPKSDHTPNQLQVLEALRSLQVYLAHLRVGLEALNPVSQAIWDEEFFQAVLYAISQVKRMQDWVTTQIKVMAPQALLVPCKVK
ncbi:hypothetical protein H9Q69_002433 [Fusarium xylarioides]|nr:hypothetical protein H9Q69_002433 [Fusarium xylarioides]